MYVPEGLDGLKAVSNEFCQQFAAAAFTEISQKEITSGIDPTVRFIGAPISVLKPYLDDSESLGAGLYIVQNCVRAHNVSRLFDVDEPLEYGSFFTGLGALASANDTEELFRQTSSFLHDRLGVAPEEAFISLSSTDEDLLRLAESNGTFSVVPDVMDPSYYRHVYGIEGVTGRNSSYWLKNRATGEFEDIGNVIIVENGDVQLGVEFAFGDTTLVKQLRGLGHVTDAYRLRLFDGEMPNPIQVRLQDCVITSMALASEGLKPGAVNNMARILRTYIKGLGLFRKLTGLAVDSLADKMQSYEEGYFPFDASGVGQLVVSWMVSYENKLAAEGSNSKEDAKILSVLKQQSIE